MDGYSQALPLTRYLMEETLLFRSVFQLVHLTEDRRELSDFEVGHSFF